MEWYDLVLWFALLLILFGSSLLQWVYDAACAVAHWWDDRQDNAEIRRRVRDFIREERQGIR